MEGKTNFSRRLKQFDGVTWSPYFTTDPHYCKCQSINQSINQFNSNLAAREPDSKWYAVEITDKNSIRNCHPFESLLASGRAGIWSKLLPFAGKAPVYTCARHVRAFVRNDGGARRWNTSRHSWSCRPQPNCWWRHDRAAVQWTARPCMAAASPRVRGASRRAGRHAVSQRRRIA